MKKIHYFLIVLAVIVADQIIKIYVKTHFTTHEEVSMIGKWAKLHFLENNGMAWGMTFFEGPTGKMILTIFRFLACVYGVYFLINIIKQKKHTGFIVCVGLILAGAIGNLLDSMFYGLMFDKGLHWDPITKAEVGRTYEGLAQLNWKGYTSFLTGSVVDMFHFPLFTATWPKWMPFVGGDEFLFFAPVFNLADAAISVGIFTIILNQNRFFSKKIKEDHPTIETHSNVTDVTQVS